MPKQRASGETFVERHALWDTAQAEAARAVEREIKREKLGQLRFSFCDQHGTLRGKTLVASEAAAALRGGVTMTSSLLAKDTSHRTVFPVFGAAVFGAATGLDLPALRSVGNIVMVPDPATFRVLPWAERSGWVLCDLYFADGTPVPLSTRALHRAALGRLAKLDFDYVAGLEVEFHLFKIADLNLAPASLAWPAESPAVTHTTHGYQYLTESRFDQVEPFMEVLRRTALALDLPLRSMEVEFGPSQYEVTFGSQAGMAAPDAMVLFRSALKQVARRHGFLASLMCRPNFPNMLASGWHLHQSLRDTKSGNNDFVSADKKEPLSRIGRTFLAGLLANARAGAAFATPTLNGYKRYHGVNSMAPIQAVWGHDNRGAMVRVMGASGDPATHLENRVGEPLANPYLYMASQIHAGLDGITRKLAPPPATSAPYEPTAEPLPKTLAGAIDALRANACFRAGFGDAFVDYFVALKQAEIARSGAKASDPPDQVTEWEHREYFDLA
ncbi:MAG TPA: glutamine synthetase family protein [Xanthobacteraceae bacterium]|nr:glutamine synthetase family protein [Xanthobacteraceae bacterium]